MKLTAVRFTPEAARLISRLHPDIKKMIRSAIDELRVNPHLGDELQDDLLDFKSYKPRRYRILYKMNQDENTIDVYYVGHRRDVYDQFRLLLKELQAD
ncbi:MAG: type II toxin-antitoxin system RelE/ParE family toxin [Deltaproteobacteria bacterium]|nr:type II toxin-antitoxin system RelE/ParE family toxin [Deltaproteobacteria bacterium]